MQLKASYVAPMVALTTVVAGVTGCSFDLASAKVADLRIAKGDRWADTLVVGELATFHAKLTDESGTAVVAAVSWGTTDSTVLAIAAGQFPTGASDQDQQADAMWGILAPKAPGTAEIVVSLDRPGARTAEFRARVVVKDVGTTLTVEKTDTIALGTGNAASEVLNGAAVSWETSDPSVVQISPVAGVSGRIQVTPRSVGTATVTATVSGDRLRPIVVAHPLNVAAMKVVPRGTWPSDRTVTDTVNLAVDVRDASGKVMPSIPVKWTSTNALAGAVRDDGQLISLSRGGTEIVVTAGGPGYQASEYRSPITVHPLTLVPGSPWPTTLNLSNAATMSIGVRDFSGAPRPLPIHWRSSNEAAFSVDTLGTVRALARGGGEVVATVGDAPFEAVELRRPMTVMQKWSAVDGGHAHTCAISASDKAGYCWGDNTYGEIGTGSVGGTLLRPARISSTMPFDQIEAGGFPAIGIAYNGEQAHSCGRGGRVIVCWGANNTSQLGSGAVCTIDQIGENHCGAPVPTGLVDSDASAAEALAVGGHLTCFVYITSPRLIYCKGMSNLAPDNLVFSNSGFFVRQGFDMTAGGYHVCAWPAISCAGLNTYGQLGTGATTSTTVPGTPVQTASGNASLTKPFSAGGYHTCATDASALVWCWGLNSSGQLGATSLNTCSSQACSVFAIQATFSQPVLDVSAGLAHTCVVTASTGDAYCWGDNSSGQLGRGTVGGFTSVPALVNGGQHFTSISAGDSHTCGVTVDGSLYCWGLNDSGQLGDGTTTIRATPVRVTEPPT